MKVIRKYHFFPLILFLSLFVDGQISFLISRFCPNSFEPTSFLFLYGFMLLSLYFSEIASIWWGVFFGFCFDVYFLRTIGTVSYTHLDVYKRQVHTARHTMRAGGTRSR